MAGSTVVVSVLADTARLTKGFSDASSKVGVLTKGLAAAAAATGAALVAVGGFVAASVKAAGEAEKIAAQTEAVLSSTGGAAQRSAEQISDLATSLSRLSGIDDEVIQGGQNMLLTFTRIQGANFDAATQAALDMSVAMGTDMTSAATLVGKALNDPIAGVSALSRVGVQLTADQKALIASFVETGDVASAQSVILGELSTQFGGSAEAFGNTWLGAVGKVQTAFGNIQESIGSAFLPVLTDAANKLAGIFSAIGDSPAFQSALAGISTFVSGLLSGSGAAEQFGAVFRVVATILNPFGLVLQALLPVLPGLQTAFLGLADALGGALLSVLPSLTSLLDTVVAALSGVLAAVLPTVISLVAQLADTFADIAPIVTPIVTLLAGILGDALTQLVPLIVLVADAAGSILSGAISALVPLLEGLAPVFTAILSAAQPLISIVISLVTPFLSLLAPIGDLIGALLPPLIELLLATSPAVQLLVPLLNLLTPALQFVADALAGVVGFVTQALAAFVALISGSEDAQAQVTAVWQSVLDFFGGISSFFADAGQWLLDVGKNMIRGLIDGVMGAAGAVVDSIVNVASGAIDAAKDFLGIRSPSRVFAGIGRNVVAGLEQGLLASNNLQPIMRGLADSVSSSFGLQLDVPTIARVSLSSIDPTATAQPQTVVNATVTQYYPTTRDPIAQMRTDAESVMAGIWT